MRIDRDPPSWRVERHRAWQRHEKMRRWDPTEEALGYPPPEAREEFRTCPPETYALVLELSTGKEARP